METYCICLDVGGTEIKAAALSPSGTLLTPIRKAPALAQESAGRLLEHFATFIGSFLQPHRTLAAICLAFPGPFDYENGVCLLQGLGKYDAWYGMNLRDALAERFALPPASVCFLNDVAAFALGELRFGQGRGAAKSLFVCVGTGCGSAFALGDSLAPEGTPGMPPQGYIYATPMLAGCLDDYLSRRGILSLSQEMLGEALDGKALAERAEAGDTGAQACYAAFGARLRDGLLPFLEGFAPAWVCLGGQITRSAAWFISPLSAACQARGIRLSVSQDTTLRALQGLLCIQ